jgi:predicted nucleic acid-binding protein
MPHHKPTYLVTCAIEDFLRPFAAPHVMEEVEEHSLEWSRRARIDPGLFREVWQGTYLPILRVAEPDPRLLTAEERDRIETLRAKDSDDIPSVTLALLLRAPYISTDGPASSAVYGIDLMNRSRSQMRQLLSEGGTHGHLVQLAGAGTAGTALVGAGLFKLAARWPVIALTAAGAAAMAGYSNRGRWKESVTGVAQGVARALGAAVAVSQEAYAIFDAETPLTASWEEMARQLPRRTLVARAAIHELARYGPGHLSAQDLAARLPRQVGGVSDRTVRAELRRMAPDLVAEVFQGRWQVGRPWIMPPSSG